MLGVTFSKLRRIALTSVIVGVAETASVAAGWNANRAAPAWLLIGGLIAVGYGVVGLIHLSLVRNANPAPRSVIFVTYYWVFPLAGTACLILAAVSGLRNVPIVIAETLQAVVVTLVACWFAIALRQTKEI